MYGDLPQLFQLMEIDVMCPLLMLVVVTLGFSQFKLNLMLCEPFSNFKQWLNVY